MPPAMQVVISLSFDSVLQDVGLGAIGQGELTIQSHKPLFQRSSLKPYQ